MTLFEEMIFINITGDRLWWSCRCLSLPSKLRNQLGPSVVAQPQVCKFHLLTCISDMFSIILSPEWKKVLPNSFAMHRFLFDPPEYQLLSERQNSVKLELFHKSVLKKLKKKISDSHIILVIIKTDSFTFYWLYFLLTLRISFEKLQLKFCVFSYWHICMEQRSSNHN